MFKSFVSISFLGRLPVSVFFGFVLNSAFKGNKGQNPFHFQHFNIASVSLLVNSKSYPATRYTPSFENTTATSKIMREYMGLMQAIGVSGGNEAPLVTLDHFHDGCTLFGFDLTPGLLILYKKKSTCHQANVYFFLLFVDNCGNFHCHKDERGTMNMELQWGKDTEEPITLICYATFHDQIEVDMDRIGNCWKGKGYMCRRFELEYLYS